MWLLGGADGGTHGPIFYGVGRILPYYRGVLFSIVC